MIDSCFLFVYISIPNAHPKSTIYILQVLQQCTLVFFGFFWGLLGGWVRALEMMVRCYLYVREVGHCALLDLLLD